MVTLSTSLLGKKGRVMKSLDVGCRANFIAALSAGIQGFRTARFDDDISARTALFVMMNSIWGNFVNIASQKATEPKGSDEVFRALLKELALGMLRSISSSDSWTSLAASISGAVESWLVQNAEISDDLQAVLDQELRQITLHFSEIFFNACYSCGNPLQQPESFEKALIQINRELWKWHHSL